MTDNPLDSNAYFSGVAEQWDEIRSGYFTEHMRDAAIAKAGVPAGAVVADVGTGTGFVAAGLAPHAAKVYGFDASAAMLAVAKRNLAKFSNVELHEAPGSRLPLPDATLDGVFANMYLHHAPDPLAAIREMVRLIMSGSASKWRMCGWALNAVTSANGWLKPGWGRSMWIAQKAPAMPVARMAR